MIYFKNEAEEVFGYESLEDKNRFGAADLVEMTNDQVLAHISPPSTYGQALDALNSAYQVDVAKLNNAFALTLLADGPTESVKMATIRAQYEARKTQHTANIAALKIEYGV